MTLLFDYIFRLGRREGHAELGVVTFRLLGTQKLQSRTKLPQELKLQAFLSGAEPNAAHQYLPTLEHRGE